jgi:tetratricopeptide (TPR) repeat protein
MDQSWERGIAGCAQNRAVQETRASLLEEAHYALLAHNLEKTKELCLRVLAEDACQPRALHMLGVVCVEAGRLDGAVFMLRRAVAAAPKEPKHLYRLAHTLYIQKKLDEAAEVFGQVIALEPERPLAYSALGILRRDQGRPSEAIACFEQALHLDPTLCEERVNLGALLQQAGRHQEAIALYRRLLDEVPDQAETYSNLGAAYETLGQWNEAWKCYRRALDLKPDFANARWNVAAQQLMRGQWREGWQGYEGRWHLEENAGILQKNSYRCPLWQGETRREGRVLLWAEQGIGDEMQFLGLLPEALRTGNRFMIDCDPRLKPLLRRSFAPELELGRVAPEEAERHGVVAHLPLGSLPRLYRNSNEAFARNTVTGYLKADAALVAELRGRYDDGRRTVGIAWHSGNKNSSQRRSIALEQLRPLFAVPGLRWINLQYGNRAELQQQAHQAGVPIEFDATVDPMVDMDGFAAQVAALDLVVTIDNSTVHMAGALGKSAWLLLPLVPDWRWMLGGNRSPWYPTLRLFRQRELDCWPPVIERVGVALEHWRQTQTQRMRMPALRKGASAASGAEVPVISI